MAILKHERIELVTNEGVVTIRQRAREFALDARLSLVDQTKLITAASELARNMVVYGGGGVVILEHVEQDGRAGVRITFEDKGPGIPDISLALRDGYTTGGGLGLGLGGAKRLVNDFDLRSEAGQGTTIVITRWK
ncbi:MAG TPA: ATP-binding protein [Thermoanaerobaculia bacterium]|nr:ATP-binding protein [Thermoanaerobaculia bacterium]